VTVAVLPARPRSSHGAAPANAINRASLVQVQAWMGHADSRTTMRYLHHKSLDAEADLLAGAFEVNSPSEVEQLLLNVNEARAQIPTPHGLSSAHALKVAASDHARVLLASLPSWREGRGVSPRRPAAAEAGPGSDLPCRCGRAPS
jgi:hypothetical protein